MLPLVLDKTFANQNYTKTALHKAEYDNCTFIDCKLVGMPFYECNVFLFSASFKNCNLGLAAFNHLKLVATSFKDSSLQQTDFTEVDLTKSKFDNCNLQDAVFVNTTLVEADFKTAYNFNFNPNVNKMKGAKFSKSNIQGLLSIYQIVIE